MPATQSVEFGASAGQTVTAKLFAAGSDTVVQTASAVTAAANRTGVYTATFTDAAAGTYRFNQVGRHRHYPLRIGQSGDPAEAAHERPARAP